MKTEVLPGLLLYLRHQVQCLTCYSHVAHQAPESMGFPRQEYWSGLPFPAPGVLLEPEIEPHISLVSCIASGFFTNEPPEKPNCYTAYIKK